ncbi:MAG: AMP-binding protein, partial [Usitatibacteraceae bacterium]
MTSTAPSTPYDKGLDKNPANYTPLSPLSFLPKAAAVFPDRLAVVHGARCFTWAEVYARARRLASALQKRGVGKGHTVSAMLANTPEMVEMHFGPGMLGAVVNTLNTRLDAEAIAFMLDHAEARVLVTDREFAPTIERALQLCKTKPIVIDVRDPMYEGEGKLLG